MINELEFSTDKGPSLRRAWAKLASRAVRMRSDLVVVALDLALAAGAFALMLLLSFATYDPHDPTPWFSTGAMGERHGQLCPRRPVEQHVRAGKEARHWMVWPW